MSLQEQIAQLQEARIQEIIASPVSKIEKLNLLETEKLFGYASYIQHEFPDWEIEAMELEKTIAEQLFAEGKSKFFYHSKMTDTIFDPSWDHHEKYETVSYASALKNMLEDVDENGMIAVILTRNPQTKLLKTIDEVIDKVFEFCVANKLVGYKNDW